MNKNLKNILSFAENGKVIRAFGIALISILISNSLFSQVTVSVKQQTIKQALRTIERVTDYRFFYSNQLPDLDKRVSFEVNDQSIDATLNRLLKETGLIYEKRENNQIYLAARKEIETDNKKNIIGTVTDERGEPVIGANVVEKGTRNGVITDIDGKFSLAVRNGATLQISYIGYETLETAVSNKSSFSIILIHDTTILDEVVVIGYGTVRKSDLTGAVGSVSSKQFTNEPVKQISQILQGRVAGVNATSFDGRVGSGTNIRIRGYTSVNNSSDPLWVVDGVLGGTVSNPADIQTIDILKDASSTAIYGSRGANGVILVTTKKGQAGKPVITFDTSFSFSGVAQKYNLLNAYEYATALNDLSGAGTIPDADMQAYKNGEKGIDWQDLMTQTGVSQDYKLSISGGNPHNKYLISGIVLDQSGITIESKYRKYAFRGNLDTQVVPWLNIITNLEFSKTTSHNLGATDGFFNLLQYSPTMELQDEDGIYLRDPYNSIENSPYGALKARDDDNESYRFGGYLDFRFKIMEGLTLSVQGSAIFNQGTDYYFVSSAIAPSTVSSMGNTAAKSFTWQNTNNLTYTKSFGDHNLTATGVFETSKNEWSNIGIGGNDLLSEKVGYWSVGTAQTGITASNNYSADQMASVFGRVMYNYKGKYYLTATLRADGSSKFQKKKWGYFPSGALAWNIAEENFMKQQDIFQQLKVRTSFGVTGNQGISSYATLGTLTREAYVYATGSLYPGYWQSTFASPDLTWEKTYQYDVGIDFSILNQRMNVSVDWYQKDTKDLLFRKSVPLAKGGGSYWVNQGEIQNSGIEMTLNAFPFQTKDWQWETTFNASYQKNKIKDLAGEKRIIPDQDRGGLLSNSYVMEPGLPISSFRLYDWVGFDDAGANLYATADGGTTTNPQDDDRIITGSPTPDWTFGWNNTIRYKNWEANILFRAGFGFQRLNITRFASSARVNQARFITLRDAYYKGWDKVANKNEAKYPSLTNTENRYFGNSTQWLEDADFLKLQNVSISYRIPKSLIKVADVSLSVSAQNLFTITGYSGMDPESASRMDWGDRAIGLDFGSYPVARTFTFGAKFDF